MNRKIIMGAVCFLLAVCICVGTAQHIRNSSSEEKTSETEISDITDSGSYAETVFETEKETAAGTAEITQTGNTSKVGTKNNSAAAEKQEKSTEKKQTAVSKADKDKTSASAPLKKQEITVSFSINSTRAYEYGADVPKYILAPCSCTAEAGTTAFDLLSDMCSKNGIQLSYQSKSYIQSIGGLAEKDCGAASGWMYKINGAKPNMSAAKYVLKNGDSVEWYYVTSAKD